MVLQALREVLDTDYRGPRAVFTQVDVLKALLAIGSSGIIGRGRLGTITGLGQGEVRTLIKRLRANDLIKIEAGGCRFTRKGEREYGKITSVLKWSGPVQTESLWLGAHCWGILVSGVEKTIRYGIEQRDAAVKAGAEGAFTTVYKAGRFTIPGEGTACEDSIAIEPWATLRRAEPEEGDAAVITGSKLERDAENGALAALLSLVQ